MRANAPPRRLEPFGEVVLGQVPWYVPHAQEPHLGTTRIAEPCEQSDTSLARECGVRSRKRCQRGVGIARALRRRADPIEQPRAPSFEESILLSCPESLDELRRERDVPLLSPSGNEIAQCAHREIQIEIGTSRE